MRGRLPGSKELKSLYSALFKKRWKRTEYLSALAAYSGYRRQLFDGIPCFSTREELHEFIVGKVAGGPTQPIDYLEFGVFEGETIRHWSNMNTNPVSRFVGFDTFEGLPEDWDNLLNHMSKGEFSTNGVIPDVTDSRVSFQKGLFQETLRPFLQSFEKQSPLIINCDADLYSATLYVLATLDHIISLDTIVLFDEFDAVTHEFRAALDYQSAFGRSLRPIGYAGPLHNHVAMAVVK